MKEIIGGNKEKGLIITTITGLIQQADMFFLMAFAVRDRTLWPKGWFPKTLCGSMELQP